MYKPFNSLFEMPISQPQTPLNRSNTTFNSLFEMQVLDYAGALRISDVPFNSLFEMHCKGSGIRRGHGDSFNSLFEMRSIEPLVMLLSSMKFFQFSI